LAAAAADAPLHQELHDVVQAGRDAAGGDDRGGDRLRAEVDALPEAGAQRQ